jgi:hypothetical protein
MALAVPLDGSTGMVGMLCPLAVSSPTSSSTVTLECLGFEKLISRNQEEGEISTERSQKYSESNRRHSPGCPDITSTW